MEKLTLEQAQSNYDTAKKEYETARTEWMAAEKEGDTDGKRLEEGWNDFILAPLVRKADIARRAMKTAERALNKLEESQ